MARAMPGQGGASFAASLPGKLRRVVHGKDGPSPSRRPWKIALALGLLGAGLYAVLADQLTLTTENAVVSAYTVGLRSPIAGQVAGLRAAPGQEVHAGTLLATVEDERADRQRLVDLRSLRDRARAELAAAETSRDEFRRLAADLAERAASHREVALAWYASQIAEAERNLAAQQARLVKDRQTLARKQQLVAAGFGTQADLDAARADHEVSARTLDAQAQRLATLHTQRAGVTRGVTVESGHIGFTYAQQRLDEVAMRLTDLNRAIVGLRAEAGAAEARLTAEEQRALQQASADLPAPTGGLVWRVLAQDGERVGAGETVAEVMDCQSAFVLAAVPASRAGEVQLGGIARFRLAGESRERSGRVQAVLAEGSAAGERNLAAVPARGPGQSTALVRVALPASTEGACPVGRTARLLLPTGEPGFLGRMLAAR
jgi:multidrug resistance efflux pump